MVDSVMVIHKDHHMRYTPFQTLIFAVKLFFAVVVIGLVFSMLFIIYLMW